MTHVKYVWDPIADNVIREKDENGNTIVNYTTEPTRYGAVLSQDRGGQVRHYHYDGQKQYQTHRLPWRRLPGWRQYRRENPKTPNFL